MRRAISGETSTIGSEPSQGTNAKSSGYIATAATTWAPIQNVRCLVTMRLTLK
jgi:hypothetical protein